MARRRRGRETATGDEHDDIIRWYWQRLSAPARFPWDGLRWAPVTHGPTWQVDDRGFWRLPDESLGWDVLGWTGCSLLHEGEPWTFTDEQARWLLWWYALDEHGRFVFRDGVLQRLKGWGKDPVVATLAAVEAFGPCRFGGWDANGHPISVDVPDSWVQVAATALEQTKNTFRIFPGLFSPEARARHRIGPPGKETVYGNGDRQFIQAVTSSPTALEGNRGTFVVRNETHLWWSSNNGHEMAAVIERNATKSADGASRALAITNAYDPSRDSIAQQDREAWELAQDGTAVDVGLMYDSLEAPPEAPLVVHDDGDGVDAEATVEAIGDVVTAVRGDSTWLDIDRVTSFVMDVRNPPSTSRRFWYNQVTAVEDAWLDPQDIEAIADPSLTLGTGEPVVMFFDGGKSDDATGLVTCRVADGALFTSGVWQRPTGSAGLGWVVNRHAVDQRARALLDTYNVVAMFADPSHAKDDEASGFWTDTIDGWSRDYGDGFDPKAVKGGPERHAISWDMTSPARLRVFTRAAEQLVKDIERSAELARIDRRADMVVRFDGSPMMRQHLRNAREYPNAYGVSLWKGHRSSRRKIDLAVCAVGARMLRRMVLNLEPEKEDKKAGGAVW